MSAIKTPPTRRLVPCEMLVIPPQQPEAGWSLEIFLKG